MYHDHHCVGGMALRFNQPPMSLLSPGAGGPDKPLGGEWEHCELLRLQTRRFVDISCSNYHYAPDIRGLPRGGGHEVAGPRHRGLEHHHLWPAAGAGDHMYCTVLYCTVLYCTALHCTVLCPWPGWSCWTRCRCAPATSTAASSTPRPRTSS